MAPRRDFKIFYSWQSDINPRFNNYFIKECLEKVARELSNDKNIEVIPTIDKDVKGETGSPNIVDTILRKIDACQIFVADVTLINDNLINRFRGRRFTPNPNVLIELGYSLSRLSWERVICLNNKEYSKVENLPFDLKQNRISQYYYGMRVTKDKAKKELTSLLQHAIREIIENYDAIEEKSRSTNVISHDTEIFKTVDLIIRDDEFINLLQQIANSQYLTHKDYAMFDNIYDFLHADRNKFLTPEIENSATRFGESLKKMRSTLAKNFHSSSVSWIDDYGNPQQEVTYTWSESIKFEYKESKTEENIDALADTVAAYKDFRFSVKKNLLA